MKFMKSLIAALPVFGLVIAGAALAEEPVKIGILADMTGAQAGISGIYDVEAVRMAVEDYGGKALGMPVEIVIGDIQYKVDLEISIAQRWFENEGVDAIFGVPLSPAAIQIAHLAERFNKIMISGTSGSRALTTTDCTANSVNYGWNTSALAKITPRALVAQGKKKWFFLTMDYVYGIDQMNQAAKELESLGGSVSGKVLYPLNQSDFSGYLLEALNSDADVVAVSSSGADTQAIMKQANEFGLTSTGKTMTVFALLISDVKAVGLEFAQGTIIAAPFYWNRNDETRAFGMRLMERTGAPPNWINAGNYSSVLTYLKAVDAAGTKDAQAVMKAMKSMKINDVYAKNGYIRQDGLMVHEMYLAQVKSPGEKMLNEWDLYNILSSTPAEEVFPPMENCKLLAP